MILRGVTDGDSNKARKAHNRRLKSFGVDTKYSRVEDSIINFGPSDLENVTTFHDDALVVHTTISNYDVAKVFVNSRSYVIIFFKEAFNWV